MIKIKKPVFLILIILSFAVLGGICFAMGGFYGHLKGCYDCLIFNAKADAVMKTFILKSLRKGEIDKALLLLERGLESDIDYYVLDTAHTRSIFALFPPKGNDDAYLIPACFYLNKFPKNMVTKFNATSISDSLLRSINYKKYLFIKKYSSKADTFQLKKDLIRQIDSLPPDSISLEQVLKQ